jgi:hypothetical protein
LNLNHEKVTAAFKTAVAWSDHLTTMDTGKDS